MPAFPRHRILASANQRVERFIWPVNFPSSSERQEQIADARLHFRPEKIRTNASAEGQLIIEEICIEGVNHLAFPVDAFEWSLILNERLYNEFLKEHGLVGKNFREIDAYCDINELEIPETGRVALPTIPKDGKLRVVARNNTSELMCVSFLGIVAL